MSIRLRLTILYSTLLALTLLVFGIALFSIQSQDSLQALKDDMRSSAEQMIEAVSRQNPGVRPPDWDNTENPPPELQPDGSVPPKSFDEYSEEKVFRDIRESDIVRILDVNGNLVASPFGRSDDALPLSEEGLAALQAGEEWWEEGQYYEENMLIYSRPIIKNEEVQGIIQVAGSLAERGRTLNSLAISLAAGSAVTILIAFGAGWLLSGASLRPIDRITKTALAIGEDRDFSRRLDHQGPQDEVGRLADTFNDMLANLQDAFEKVENSLQQQRNFVSDVSHELRTPLTTLRGNLGLLLRKPHAPEDVQEDILTDMVDENDRLIRLVNDLLLMAHVDAGRKLRNNLVEIRPVLEDVIRQAKNLDPGRSFDVHIDDECEIQADRDALKQVLLIIVDNAIKYSENGIEIRAEELDSSVQIWIRDQGEGIAEKDLDHIFERFYRAAYKPGFGLGLSIANGLVQAMDGQIEVQSELGKGTSFMLRFQSDEK